MNCKFLFSFALLLTQIFAFSQVSQMDVERENFFRVGGKVGVNINKIQGESFKSGYSYNYLLGGFMQFNFSKRFGIQPEVNFAQSSAEFASDATEVFDDLTLGSQKNSKLSYLKVPVFLNVNIGSSKRVKLQVGPQVSVLLKGAVDSLGNSKDLYKKTDWGVVGGLWIQIPFINLGARYEQGLSNINRRTDLPKWRNQAFTIFAGFTL